MNKELEVIINSTTAIVKEMVTTEHFMCSDDCNREVSKTIETVFNKFVELAQQFNKN